MTKPPAPWNQSPLSPSEIESLHALGQNPEDFVAVHGEVLGCVPYSPGGQENARMVVDTASGPGVVYALLLAVPVRTPRIQGLGPAQLPVPCGFSTVRSIWPRAGLAPAPDAQVPMLHLWSPPEEA